MDREDVRVMHEALYESEEALTYLTDRGLGIDIIDEAQLGYASWERGGQSFGHSIAIPYFDAQGRCRLVRYRHLRPNPFTKYHSPAGVKAKHLYNVGAVNSPVVAIVEGEFDSLIIRQLGVPAVAIAGVNAWERSWRLLFRDCDTVFVVTDEDPSKKSADGKEVGRVGQKARAKIAAQVGSIVDNVVPVQLPEGIDATELYLKDPDHLRGLLTWE